MPAFDRFSQDRKIRTISADTNVISDAFAQALPDASSGRVKDSLNCILLMLSIHIRPCGIPLVRKELSAKSGFAELYDILFDEECAVTKDARRLAEAYQRRTSLHPADALIAAIAAAGHVDVVLTWNRKDLLTDNIQRTLQKINKNRGLPHPVFATPSEFLSHVILAENRTPMLTSFSVPAQFRPSFSLSR